jgi:hypothetical protein
MKIIHRIIGLLLLLVLTACGAVIQVSVRLPERPTDAATSTIIAAPATNTPTATTSPTNTPTASPSYTNTPTGTASPTSSATIAAGLSATTTANVNLRTGPATTYTIIRVLLTGTKVQIVGRFDNNTPTWAKTTEGNWIYSQNLTITGNINTLPIVGIVPTASPTIDPSPTRESIRIGYNINGEAVPDMVYLLDVMTSPCGTLQLVMNNLSLAVRIKELCPSTIVVSRNYSALEGDEWYYRSAQNFVDQWKREGHPEIVRHSTNEPSFGRGARLAEFVASEVELMRVARANGFTLAMGNFSVGIFEPEDINAGLFDNYIRAINTYGHYLALHEYAVVALPFGVGQWQVSALLDRTRVQPVSWPSALALPTRLWSGELPPYWYLRRGDWWLLRADAIGVARPRILLTEFGWDNLPNIKSYIEPLRQQYGLDKYFDDMRGINTYPNVWRWYWPQWTFAQAACEQLKWADMIYPPEYIGFALFTWSTNPHWLQTDFSGRENPQLYELHDCLEDYSQN